MYIHTYTYIYVMWTPAREGAAAHPVPGRGVRDLGSVGCYVSVLCLLTRKL